MAHKQIKSQTEILFSEAANKLKNQQFKEADEIFQNILELNSDNKGSIFYEIAVNVSNNTDYSYAEKYWAQVLNHYDSINDLKSKADILHNQATIILNKGYHEIAEKLWNESITIKEKIGDELGIAASLNNLGYLLSQENKPDKAKEVYLRSAKILGNKKAWTELVNVLLKLSEIEPENNYYLSQALYLSLFTLIDTKSIFSIISKLLKNITFENEYAPIIASAGIALTWNGSTEKDDIQIQNTCKDIMVACGLIRNITEENIGSWIIEKNLNDPDYIFSKLKSLLTDLSGNREWFFERNILNNL